MPERSCVACGVKRPRGELVRVVRQGGVVVVDGRGSKPGRGAYLCSAKCAKQAVERRGFQRSFRAQDARPGDGFLEAVEGVLQRVKQRGRQDGGRVDPETGKI